jgi:TolB-like protein
MVICVVSVGLALAINYLRRSDRARDRSGSHRIEFLAVLPLQNLSGDPGQEYFSDGMTDELITELAKIKGLKVISHTSVERYKATKRSLTEIAKELGVDAVVEGTVVRSGSLRVPFLLTRSHPSRYPRRSQRLTADEYYPKQWFLISVRTFRSV